MRVVPNRRPATAGSATFAHVRTLSILPAAAGALLLVPAVAPAATLSTDSRCYQETQDVIVAGSGFRPNSFVTVSREGRAVGSATTDAQGAFRRRLATDELPRDRRESIYDLAATDGTATAVTRYRLSRVFADFSPGKGDPKTLRVRFKVNGFSLLKRRSTVYLHYVDPDGDARRTIKLGRAKGTCGRIIRTKKRLLFPFEARRGKWILQFDTNREYRRPGRDASFIWVRKPVEIFNDD